MSIKTASTARVGLKQNKPKAGDWSFVNNCGPNENEETRRLVRANAMRDYWRRKKQQKPRNEKRSVFEDRVTSARDKIPRDNLVPNSSSHLVWCSKEKAHSSQETRPGSDCETESAVEKGYNGVSSDFGETRCIPWEGRDCGRNAGSGYHWITVRQAPGLPMSPGLDVIDPFNAMPIGGSPRYNGFVISHCKSPLAQAFLPLAHIMSAKR